MTTATERVMERVQQRRTMVAAPAPPPALPATPPAPPTNTPPEPNAPDQGSVEDRLAQMEQRQSDLEDTVGQLLDNATQDALSDLDGWAEDPSMAAALPEVAAPAS